MALLMSGSLGFVITACKAVCLWVELLLKAKGHTDIREGGEEEKAKR